MGDTEPISRQEFDTLKNEVIDFKTTIIKRVDVILEEVKFHINKQEQRQKEILNYLNSDEFLNYKSKLKKS